MPDPTERRIVLGFLTVQRTADGGLRGGYLLTSEYGRPQEFHYTTELVIAGRQRTLYGGIALECLHVETFALPLLARQTVAPHAVMVDVPSLLEVRPRIPAPIFLVRPGEIVPHPQFPLDAELLDRLRAVVPPSFSWSEPFDRLAEALGEIRDAKALAA